MTNRKSDRSLSDFLRCQSSTLQGFDDAYGYAHVDLAKVRDLEIGGQLYWRLITDDDRTLVLLRWEQEGTAFLANAFKSGDPRGIAAAFDPILIQATINGKEAVFEQRRRELEVDGLANGYGVNIGEMREMVVMVAPNGCNIVAVTTMGDFESIAVKETAPWLFLRSANQRPSSVSVSLVVAGFQVSAPDLSASVTVPFVSTDAMIDVGGVQMSIQSVRSLIGVLSKAIEIANDTEAALLMLANGESTAASEIPHTPPSPPQATVSRTDAGDNDDTFWRYED